MKNFFQHFFEFFQVFFSFKMQLLSKNEALGTLNIDFSKSMRHIQNPSDKNLDMIIIFGSLSCLCLTNDIQSDFRGITLKNTFLQKGLNMLH